ncbi:ABC transporter ATP-binding protein [Hyphococcus luteus]|uniref:ABC transporter ATP-binding protein n=1 Tax=Hyphococcus luteus TaxID=2058213 RepID=A0A2S7K5I4_9PROT|nr:ABC transporter ATP-binding protein [Marinicaulis flavus]PQA87767.1 ABC transporter ATP-binding protein [Marinicaulis flavus]
MSLSLTDISHHFGAVRAVDGASLDAVAGEIVCLFGPSGCGKTTLLRLAAGLEPLQAGEVALDGETLATPDWQTPPEKRPVGFVFQDYVLFPHLTVEKNIAFGLKGARDAKVRIAGQLKAFGIEELARRYPHELSGGQQQRVALARAMARKPKALLLDEPFASIDVALRRRLREELRRVLKEQKAAVLLVTHDAEEALALGDRIALMREGKIVETASPEDLYNNPQTPEGAGLFPGCQILDGEIRDGAFRSILGETAAPGVEGGAARAILRADCLAAREDPNGPFRAADIRFAGPGWLVRLDGPDKTSVTVRMDAPPEPGATLSVAADWSKAFIFRGE